MNEERRTIGGGTEVEKWRRKHRGGRKNGAGGTEGERGRSEEKRMEEEGEVQRKRRRLC